MAKGKGFFGRLFDKLVSFFEGDKPERRPEPPAQPEPPEPPPVRPPRQVYKPPTLERKKQREYRIIKRAAGERETLDDYDSWDEIFSSFEHMFDNDEEKLEYWDEFLRAYYLTTSEPGHVPRRRFHSDSGIPTGEMDWDLWRQIKRGTP